MTKKRKKSETTSRTSQGSDENTILLYLREINTIPLLSKEEEEKTARLAAQGNKAAREKLIRSNLRFVVSIAKKYQGKGIPLQDLISEGNIGLINAVNHFDVEKGFRFITYAVWWIRQAIFKAIYEKAGMIRQPVRKNKRTAKLRGIEQDGSGSRRSASLQETATDDLGYPINASQEVLSLDDPASSQGNSLTVKDFIECEYYMSPEEQAANLLLREDLEEALKGLEERSAEIIRCRFGLGGTCAMTLKEVGERYNLTRERIRQIEKRALDMLQCSVFCDKLNSYLAS